MRKLILTAGVAALAIAAPAAAKPGGHNGGGQQAEQQQRGGQKAQRGGGNRGGYAQVQRGGGGNRSFAQQRGGNRAFAQQRGGGGGQQRMARHQGGEQRFAIQSHGGGRAAQMQRRGAEQRQAQRMQRNNVQRFANFQTERGHGNGKAQAQMQRRNERVARIENRAHGNARVQMQNRGQGNGRMQVANRIEDNRRMQAENRAQRFAVEHRGRGNPHLQLRDNGNERVVAFDQRGRGNGRVDLRTPEFAQRLALGRGQWRDREIRVAQPQFVQRVYGTRYFDANNYDRVRNTVYYVSSGLPAAYVGGCPPNLVWDSWSCVPPYYAETQFVGQVLPSFYGSNYFPQSLRYMYADTPDYYYRWGDGYAYRVNRSDNLISALLPLIGAGLGVGMPFPYSGSNYYVPSYYQSFYPNYGYGNDYYRYANGYVYQIDGGSGYIEDVIPLLDRGYGVGQLLPVSYSYYNVPYQYRSLYYDTPDYTYRYAPGAIYQVDRNSQLITAIASLLTSGLAVGQPMPAAYSAYNVPMAYRSSYYDTPDAWYRYSDGYIYRVDPTTQLVTSIVRTIV